MALKLDRVKHLVKVLRGVIVDDTREFDMGNFMTINVQEAPKVEHTFDPKTCKIKAKPLEEGFCRTSACVLGWAALDKKFNEQGLNVDIDYSQIDGASEGDQITGTVVYRGGSKRFDDFEAGAKFFGMTEEQAGRVFNGPWKTPKQAAAFFDDLAKGKVHFATSAEIRKDQKGDYIGFSEQTVLNDKGEEVELVHYVT